MRNDPPTFDPWTASFEEARAAQELLQIVGNPTQPIFQWSAARQIESTRARCEAGDGYWVMFCVHLCAWHGLVMPEWLARDFMHRFRLVNHYQVRTWDEAFGNPNPPKINLAAARRRRKARTAVFPAMVKVLRKSPADVAIDREGFFEAVGREIGESGSQAEKLYQRQRSEWFDTERLRDAHAGTEHTTPSPDPMVLRKQR